MRTFAVLLATLVVQPMQAGSQHLLIASGSRGAEPGIHVAEFDSETGKLGPARSGVGMKQPTWLVFSSEGDRLYASGIAETNDTDAGCVQTFSFNSANGQLTLMGAQPTNTKLPIHMCLSADGRHVIVTSYIGRETAVMPVGPDGVVSGILQIVSHSGSSIHPERQAGSFPHSVNLDPANRFAFLCDLGADQIARFRFDSETGALEKLEPLSAASPGAGPRHMVFHPDGRRAYVVNELDSTLTAYDYDATSGTLVETQSVALLPPEATGKQTAAEVRVHPSGRFVYATNRGHEDANRHDSIVVLRVDVGSGRLDVVERVSTGKHPRHFAIDAIGRWIALSNRDSDAVQIYRIDTMTGRLGEHGPPLPIPMPLSVVFSDSN